MKQLLIISGKGGTGKTIMAGALACLAKDKVLVDCDVDAADLHLLLHPKVREERQFSSGRVARIDKEKCVGCGQCVSACRFNAISPDFIVDEISCEGCTLCTHVCPQEAILMQTHESGDWFVSETPYGPMVHAQLGVAEENSGKLVSVIREKAKDLARQQNRTHILIDGPPGIGCPVISSLSGVDLALIVTEPTLSALHDLMRVQEVARHFHVPTAVVINKCGLNEDIVNQIEHYCEKKEVAIMGRIPFDKVIVDAIVQGVPLPEFQPDHAIVQTLKQIWEQVK